MKKNPAGKKRSSHQLTLAELVDSDFVLCGQCRKVYTHPVSLPCMHVLCLDCVVDLVLGQVNGSLSLTQDQSPSSINTSKVNRREKGLVQDQILKESRVKDGWQVVLNLLNDGKDVSISLSCPTCNTSFHCTSTATQEAKDRSPSNAARSMTPIRPDVAKDDECKAINHETKTITETEALVRVMVRGILEKLFPVNSFIESLSQLHQYKHQTYRECVYCQTDGELAPATGLCLDCQDDLCDDCTNSHRKTRLTRHHSVATYTSIQQGLFDHDIRSHHVVPCPAHPHAPVSQFCSECLQVVCQTCASRDHKDHDTSPIEKARDKFLPDMKQIQQALTRKIPLLSVQGRALQEQISKLNTTKAQVVAGIHSQVEQIHKMVDKYKDHILLRLDDACHAEQAKIQDKINRTMTSQNSLTATSRLLLYLANVGRPDELLALYQPALQAYNQQVAGQPDTMATRLASMFTPGPSSELNVKILVGMLDLLHVPPDQEDVQKARLTVSTLMPVTLTPPELKRTFTAVSREDSNTVYPCGLAVNKSMIAVVDRENARVKIFSPSGQFLGEFSGEGEARLKKPFGAVFLPSGALAVSDSEAGSVKVFDWTGRFITNFSGDLRHPRGVTLNNQGEVIVVDGHLKYLSVHDASTGEMIRKIYPKVSDLDEDNDRTPSKNHVLTDPYYIAITSQDNIIVTDMASPHLKIMNQNGFILAASVQYGIREEEALHPSGLCVDKFGQILLADTNNSRIHLGLPNGQMPSLLATETDGLSKPVSLAINGEGHLIIAQSGGEIRELKYL